jgi:transcription-repair coupling factor (superfamily II helicase)
LPPVFETVGVKAHDFLSIYRADSLVQTLAEGIRTSAHSNIRLKGLHGSLDTVIFAAVYKSVRSSHVLIAQDKEEASYLLNDLQHLLGEKEVLYFPMSYKKPYEYDEIENANILMRSEVLNVINGHPEGNIIVTYPEAISEKVINKKSLATNTFLIKKGEILDRGFLEEFLHSYDFEKTDFVFEAGQFAIRGGIIDVFSFAHELPYRIELFGEEVDSIRSFDPGSQLSVETIDKISLMPNVQTRLVQEERQSLFDFISPATRIWLKDVEMTRDVVEKCFEKASASFDKILRESGQTKVVLEPDQLFNTGEAIMKSLGDLSCVEFGSRYTLEARHIYEFNSSAQPSFNKNFELLAANLLEQQELSYSNFISTEQPRQVERLHGIFEEIHPEIKFQSLDFSLRQGFVDHVQKIVCYTDHQIFERFYRYRHKEKFSKSKSLTFRELQTLQPGDFVTHIDYGIGKFAGLEKKVVDGREQEAIRLVFRDDDLLTVSIHALHKISNIRAKTERHLLLVSWVAVSGTARKPR